MCINININTKNAIWIGLDISIKHCVYGYECKSKILKITKRAKIQVNKHLLSKCSDKFFIVQRKHKQETDKKQIKKKAYPVDVP